MITKLPDNKNQYDFNLHFVKKQENPKEKNILIYTFDHEIIIKSFGEVQTDVKCELFDLMGRKLKETKIEVLELFSFNFYQKGVFLIRLTTDNQTISKKICL